MIAAGFTGRLGDFALDVDLQIPTEGVTILFGDSGCGKTTLLRCLAGLTRLPGRLSVNGHVWQDDRAFLPPHRRPVGYVFQEASLFAHLSVRANLTYGRRRTPAAASDMDRIVALLGLAPLLNRGPDKLSGGERQRVAIGRALLADPMLLLMDEPLAGLDAARKDEVLPYLDALHRQSATPIIYVTHDAGEAARLGDRVVVMRQGRIVRVDDLRVMPTAGDHALAARLAEIGPQALAAEFALQGLRPLWRGWRFRLWALGRPVS